MSLRLNFDAPAELDMFAGMSASNALRWYQEDAYAAIMAGFQSVDSQLLLLATGLGKTTVASAVVRDWDGPVLWLANRDELVQQARRELEEATGSYVEVEQATSKCSSSAKYVVGSLDSVRGEKRLNRLGHDRFSLVVFDECFPAGTLVDGRPIETIRPGDMVLSVDHSNGTMRPQRVLRSMRKIVKRLTRLTTYATAIECTGNHPVFVKGRGYVEADQIVRGDMLLLRGAHFGMEGDRASRSADLLKEMLGSSQVGREPTLSGKRRGGGQLYSNESQEPNAERGGAQQGVKFASGDEASPACARRQRDRADQGGGCLAGSPGGRLGGSAGSPDAEPTAQRGLADLLQDRRGEPCHESGDRGGRQEPLCDQSSDSGPAQGELFTWAKVDCVESFESPVPGGTPVYNLEVERSHTYFANGILVHNCHMALAPTYRKVLEWFHCKRLGLTATPDRTDEKSLGQLFDSVAYVMDIWDGVEAGYLVPVEGQRVFLKEIDLENVHSRGGDLVASELDEAMLKAVEGICVKTLELYPDRNGLAFFPGVRSAEYAMQRFNALKPGSAVFVDGKTDDMERRRAVEDFRKGRVQFLCNCLVFTTGFDAPATDLIIQGRPTGSRSLYTQMLGRGTRVLPGTVDHIASRNDSEARRAAIAASKKPNLVVLDFVGNSGKHSLMGPEDALGGSFTEDEVALAKKISKRSDGATNAREALLKARRELMMKAMDVKAKKVDAEVHPFDPFKVLGVTVKDSDRYTDRFGLKPMSEGQRSILELKGVPAKELATLSFKAASKLIENLKDRQKRGLCTYKQLRLLQKFGINDTDVTFDRATAGVTYIKAKGWGSNVDGRELAAIIHHRRQAGED